MATNTPKLNLVQVIYTDRSTLGVTGINVDTLTFLTDVYACLIGRWK